MLNKEEKEALDFTFLESLQFLKKSRKEQRKENKKFKRKQRRALFLSFIQVCIVRLKIALSSFI